MRLIDSDKCPCRKCKISYCKSQCQTFYDWLDTPVDAEPVRHGKWLLEAHKENANYRWNVTAECSECTNDLGEIWAGFFHSVPDSIARGACIVSAESVELSKYCPNCGAKMG